MPKVQVTPFESLVGEHGAPIAFHRRLMAGEHLGRQKRFRGVLRADGMKSSESEVDVFDTISPPKTSGRLDE